MTPENQDTPQRYQCMKEGCKQKFVYLEVDHSKEGFIKLCKEHYFERYEVKK